MQAHQPTACLPGIPPVILRIVTGTQPYGQRLHDGRSESEDTPESNSLFVCTNLANKIISGSAAQIP